VTLAGVYAVICAFRSIWPRADVERYALFDSWISTVLVGRAVATVAELCFVAQWSLALRQAAKVAGSKPAERIAMVAVPLIAVAECFSWYAVISTNFLGNVVEESIWTVTGLLAVTASALLRPRYQGAARQFLRLGVISALVYVAFMSMRDVPMYFHRWLADEAVHKHYFSLRDGLSDLASRCVVTDSFEKWREEIPWMTLYFSVAVWFSLALCVAPLRKSSLQSYLAPEAIRR
jgi:hypothetical protein